MTAPDVRITRVVITKPHDGDCVSVSPVTKSIEVRGRVEPVTGDVQGVDILVVVYPDQHYATAADIPGDVPEEDIPISRQTHPNANGEWVLDRAGPVRCTASGLTSQVVVWAFNPTGGVARTSLVNFKAVCERLNSGESAPTGKAATEGAAVAGVPKDARALSIDFPSDGNPSYPVNNAPGSMTGVINAGGTIFGVRNAPVFLLVLPNRPYVPATIPPTPLIGSIRTTCNGSGVWSSGGVGGARCSNTSPYAQNQLLVWAFANGTYQRSLANFDGRCMN